MELWVTAGVFFFSFLLAAWKRAEGAFERADHLLSRLAASPLWAAAVVGFVAVLVYALPSFWHVPVPVVHDEFAYLLQGDTFAHGRLTNQPHPLARYFETFHVLQSPTYMAKFPPGTGLTLAVGFWLGLPIAGVWFSVALACVALNWTLRAVMPARWALLVALLAALHPTIIWFSQTYWGGAVAMAGGALLGGGMLRWLREPRTAYGIIGGAGIGLLMISRPFEGLLVSIVCGFAVLICACREGNARLVLMRFVPALAVVPMLVGSWLMYDNWRVTGHPLLMPYALHTKQYMSAPLFFWQGPPEHAPTYPNEQMRQFHTQTEFAEYESEVGYPDYLLSMLNRGGMIVWAYLRPVLLLIPLVVAAVTLHRRREVLLGLMVCGSVLLVHLAICPWMRIAYMAPLVGLLLTVIGLGLRRIDRFRIDGQPIGRAMVRAIVVTSIAMGLVNLIQITHDNAGSVFSKRDQIVKSLEQQGGQHLILVRYGTGHSASAEWVYNAADIDASPVIFARDFGEEADYPLLSYYANRKVWLLEVTNRQVQFSPYSASGTLGTNRLTGIIEP